MKEKMFRQVSVDDYKIYKVYSKELNTMVYALDVEAIKGEPENFKSIMPEDRYNKLLRYRNKIDKLLLLGNEILFDYGIKDFCNIKKETVKRQIDVAGKPYIDDYPDLYFNMSHAGKYSLCAFSNQPIGVDIEFIKPISLSIAERFYCRSEYIDIMEREETEQCKRFYEYWVLNESFTKALGLGLSVPLNAFQLVEKEERNLLKVRQTMNHHEYLCQEINFYDDAYELAICVQVA